jgi:hypothetical protein
VHLPDSYLGWKVLAEKSVGAPENKVPHFIVQLRHPFLPQMHVLIAGIRLAPSDDRDFVMLSKFGWGAEKTGVAEVDHRVKL